MSLQGAPPPPATDTQSGLLSHLAQLIGGVKTFVSLLIASAGIQVASLFNTNGAGATDVCLKLGTSTPYGTANAAAKLAWFGYGIGGTETEHLTLTKNGLYFNGYPNSAIYCTGSWLQLGILPVQADSYFVSKGTSTAFYANANGAFGALNTARLWSEQAKNAGDIGVKIGCLQADVNVDPSVKVLTVRTGLGSSEVEKLSVTKDGTVELYEVGAGVVLRSPNGTRWKLTITNAGAVSVALA